MEPKDKIEKKEKKRRGRECVHVCEHACRLYKGEIVD